MPPSDFEEFIARDIPTVTVDSVALSSSEFDPPLPPVLPGTERLQWMRRYRDAFQSIKLANVRMADGLKLYQRLMPKCLQRLKESNQMLEDMNRDLMLAEERLITAKLEIGFLRSGLLMARREARVKEGVIAELTGRRTHDGQGCLRGT